MCLAMLARSLPISPAPCGRPLGLPDCPGRNFEVVISFLFSSCLMRPSALFRSLEAGEMCQPGGLSYFAEGLLHQLKGTNGPPLGHRRAGQVMSYSACVQSEAAIGTHGTRISQVLPECSVFRAD